MTPQPRPGFPPLLKFGAFPEAIEARLCEVFTLFEPDSLDDNPSLQASIAGIVTRSNYQISTGLIDRLPALRIIATNGVGYDGIPVGYAASKGIVVTNTPEVLNQAVAELAIGLLLSLLRQLPAADRFVRTGAWERTSFPLGANLAGKKVGIVGLGRIGKEIVKRLLPFEVEISYFGRQAQPVPWRYFGALEALSAHVDILILSCPGGSATRHIINSAVLNALGPDGVIVNVARGSVVNEEHLYDALCERRIRGAALDVFETEPLGDCGLRALPNVIFSPHVGSATQETRLQMAELALRNLVHFFETGKAITPVATA